MTPRQLAYQLSNKTWLLFLLGRWDYLTQCNGDVDGSGSVDTGDWTVFRDGFYKSYPDMNYIKCACADVDRDGDIDTEDWPIFRDNFFKSVSSDCPQGDLNGIFR